jgi:drug/metabolite transporter (DMT)-like permease
MSWPILALLASLTWAAVQLIDKTLIDSTATPSSDHYLVVSGATALLPVLLMPLIFSEYVTIPNALSVSLAIGAGACYFVANAFFFRAVSYIDASVTAAALAAVPALTAVGSWLILNETFGWLAIAGLVSITLGVFVMSQAPTRGKKIPRKAWLYLALAELVFVAEYLLEGTTVRHLSPLTVFFWTRIGILLCLGVLASFNLRFTREAFRWAFLRSHKVGLLTLGNECLDMVAITLLIASYRSGSVGLATALAYTQSAFVFLATLGVNFLRPGTIPTVGDRPGTLRWRLGGLVFVMIGVVLASLK